MAEVSEYDKYNTLAAQVNGPIKPKKEETIKAPKIKSDNKYEALRQSGVESSVIGRNESDKSTAFMGSKDDGPNGVVAGQDTAEEKAFRQSGTEQIFSGLSKGTGLFGTSLANTFIGLPYGIIKASYDGLSENTKSKGEVFSDVYDNEFTRQMDKLNKGVEEAFPNYYSKKEQQADALSWDNIGTSNFWGDKVLKNAGFTAAAILGGGVISKGIRASSWLAKAFVGTNELTEGGLATTLKALIDGGMDAASASKKVVSGVRALNSTAALTTSAWVSAGEASGEAIQTKQELKKSLDDRYKLEHGVNEVPVEEQAHHDKLASNAGNSVFAANMALLMGTESFQFGKLWAKGFTPELARAEKLAFDESLKAVVKQPSFTKRVLAGLGKVVSNGLAESFEEGTQTALQAGNKDYFSRQYDKDSLTNTNSVVNSTLEGLQATFGNKDGIESMLLGAITGIGSHVATSSVSKVLGKINGVESDDSRTQAIADVINKQEPKLAPFIKSITRADSITKSKEANLKSANPSRVLYENDTHDEFKNIIQPFIEADRFDLLEDKLNNEFQKDDEEFKRDNPDTQLNRKTSKEYVAKLVQDAKKLKANWENIDEMFPKSSPQLKEMMWSTMSDIQNKDSRIKSLALEVAANSGILFNENAEEYLTRVQEAYEKDPSSLDINKARDVVQLDAQKKAQIEIYKKLLDPAYQTKVQEVVAQKEEEKKNHFSEPVVENKVEESVSEPISNTSEEDVIDAPQATQNNEEGNPITNPEIAQPEASNKVSEPINEGRDIDSEANDLVAKLKPSIDSGENSLEDIYKWLDEQEGDEDDDKVIARVKQLLAPKPIEAAKVEEPIQETETVEDRAKSLADTIQESIKSGENTLPDVLSYLDGMIDKAEDPEDKAVGERTKELIQASVEDLTNDQIDEVNEKVEDIIAEEDSNEGITPTITEDDEVQSTYNEMDRMSATAFRTTTNHEEAIKDGIWSIIRYQNFINNPNTSLTGLRLQVITPQSSLYAKVQNKKQRAFEDKKKTQGETINGIYAVVVDESNNLVITDTSGEITKKIEPGEFDGDVDNELEGILVTTLVSNAEQKESGFNAVSYQNFARSNGFDKAGEKEAKDPNHPVGMLWNEHKQDLSKTRQSILDGSIKYLKIEDTSSGIFQDTKAHNPVGETLGIDINDPRLSFIIPKVEDIGSKNKTTTIGANEGLSKEQTVKVGKPYLIYNGKLYPLNARKLNAKEVGEANNLLNEAYKKYKNSEKIGDILKKVKELVYINDDTMKTILKGQLSGEDLTDYLFNKYRQVNANQLATSPTYRTSVLEGNDPAITINYNPHPTTVKDKPNYLNGYLVYSPVEDKVEGNTEVKEEPKQVTVDQVITPAKELTLAQRLALLNVDDNEEEEDNGKLLRTISNQDSNKKENISEAKKWFEDRFNGESFEVVDSLLNGNAFGEYTQAATRLYEGAEEGTVYHEAFHKVTQEYLTPKQVKSLYDAVRKNINPKFSDLQAEEWLAEEFRKFVLNGQKAIKNMPYTNNIFRKLYNWIKSLVTGKTTPQQIFDRLASNKGYTGAKKFNNQQFTKLERAIPGTTHAQTKDILASVNGHFFRRLFAAGYTPDEILGDKGKALVEGIYGRVFDSLKRDYAKIVKGTIAGVITEDEFKGISQHYELMLNIQDGVPTSLNTAIIASHKNYLKGLGISLSDKVGEEEVEVDQSDKVEGENAESEDRSRDSAYDKNSNEESSINSAPNSIKLLIMSLPQVDKDGQATPNNIGGPQLNDYLQTMKLLYSNLNGLSQFHEMYAKMKELAPRFPVFNELLSRLGEPGSNKELNQFLLENDFRQAFSKFESKGTITLINPENGEVYQVDANANKLKDRIKENWTSNLRVLANDKDSYIKKQDDGLLALDKSFITDARAGKFKGNSKALFSALGVEFTDLTQEQVQAIPNIKDITNTVFKYVAKAIEEGKTINDLFSKDADIRGQMSLLLDIEAPLSKETVELSYISAEGKRIYAVSLNNYYSLVVNALNNSKTRDELFTNYPHLNNPYTQNSIWIKNLFDKAGNKIPGQRIYMNTVSGLKIQNDNDSGIGATKMEPSDKIVQEFNDLLTTGSTSLIRAADKSSEYAFGITSYGNNQKLAIPLEDISKEGFSTSKVHEIFFGYFMDELNRIRAFNKGVGKDIATYNKQAGDFSLFADILSPETLTSIETYKTTDEEIDGLTEAKINKDLVDYLYQYAKENKKYMQDRKVSLKSNKGFTGINTSIATTEEELDNAIKTFTVNHLVNMIEQSKLLIGDSAFYKDKIKRISSGTGTKKFAASSKLVDNWFNNFYKNEVGRVDNKTADGKLNVVIFDDVQAQLDTFEDYVQALVDKGVSKEKANEILAAYKGMDEGDAQGWITLDEYREFMMRVGGAYWTSEHEAQYRYERALEAQDNNQELTPWMIKALEKNPEFYFMPIKAQHMGPQNIEGLYAPAFHKYSLSPLYHSLVKGRNMEKMLDTMRDKKVGYALFGSGSKVGTPLNSEGKLPAFYNKEGELAGIQEDTPIQSINYENLGIQLDIAPKVKESLIFGSQTRKLLFSNIFGENVKPEFTKLGEEYNKLIDNLVTYEFDKLTKKLGLKVSKDEDGSYKSFTFNGDYRKLVNQLKEQLEDKDTADNVLDSLQVNEDGSLRYPIDSLVNRSKIESMLFTIVNSKVIKQKMNGNSLVQLASSGFENIGKREVGQSNYLAFYTNKGKDGKTTAMEVEIPINKNFAPLLNKYKTVEGVNQAISEGKIDAKQLTMIGYRIPTQGLNSMDVMTIKRFMPSESGIAIILPTGVVAKSGGDYDIDKLNIFMPNLFYDEKSDYVGSHAISKNTQGQDYKKAAQNKIIDIMSEVLTHPDNFIDLTTPNTTDDLVNLTAKIRAAQGNKGIDKASMTKQFRFDYLMEQFTYFLGGKAALGIAATHNTHHVVSQIAGVKLNANLPFKYNKSGDQLDLGQIYTQGGQKITDIINQFINAYVDVAKDPFYKDLNAGTEVSSVWMYMLRAGVDLETIGYFMTQPIILEYVNARKLNKSLVTTSNNKAQGERFVDLSDEGRRKIAYKIEQSDNHEYKKRWQQVLDNGSIYNDLLAKYGNSNGKYRPQSFSGDNANDDLRSLIAGENKNGNFKDAQTYLLEKFLEIEKQSGELTKLMQATNNDTTKIQNYGSVFKREQAEAEVRNTEREGNIIPAGTIDAIWKKTIIGSFNRTREFSDMYKELTLYTKYPQIKSAVDKLVSEIPTKADWDKEYTKIQNDFIGYLLQKYGKTVDGQSINSKVALLSGDNSLAKQLINLRKEGLVTDNPLFDELVGLVNADSKGIDNVKLYSRRMSAFESNIMTEAFRSMLESNNPRVVEFAQNLAYITILQSGLQNSPITFTELIPFDFYNQLTSNAIKNVEVDNQGQIANDFTTAYYNNKNSGYGFRLQDYGIKEENKPTVNKEVEVLPQQNDSILDTNDSTQDEVENTDIDTTPTLQEIKKELADILWKRAVGSKDYKIYDDIEDEDKGRLITLNDYDTLKSGKELAQDRDGDVSWRDILENEFFKITKKDINQFDSYSEAFNLESLIEGVQDTTDEDYISSLHQFNNLAEVLPSIKIFNPSTTQNAIREANKISGMSEEDGDVIKNCKL